MNWISQIGTRSRMQDDLRQEIREHINEKVEALVAEGYSREDAERRARVAFGNAALVEERGREVWMWPLVESVIADIKLALRTLRRSPGFTVTAVLTLALGIGANTSIFSVVDGILFRPLPVPHPANLIAFDTAASRLTRFGSSSYQDWVDIRARSHSFQDLAIYEDLPLSLSQKGGEAQFVHGLLVSDNYFSALGVRPAIGRGFLPEEGQVPGRDAIVVISDALWRDAFASDSAIAGKEISLNGHAFTIVGVAPASFTGVRLLDQPDVYVPVMMSPVVTPYQTAYLVNRDWRGFEMNGRLRDGVTLAQARAEVDLVMRDLERQHPKTNKDTIGIVRYEMQRRMEGHRLAPSILLGLVILVLLIACANVAGLMMAKATSRLRETSTQLALGATRGRLVRKFLTECVILAGLGAGSGVLFAKAGIRGLAALTPPDGTPVFQIDLRALAWTAATSAIAILFGIAPAFLSVREAWAAVATTRTSAAGHRSSSGLARRILIGGQVALSVVLLITAGLFVQSFVKAAGVDLGFRPNHVLLVELDPGLQGISGDQAARFQRQLMERTSALPAVRSVSFASGIPFLSQDSWDLSIDGYTTPAGDRFVDTATNRLAPSYLATMGIPLRCGREFMWNDSSTAPEVAIVSETLARRYLVGNGSLDGALGHVLRLRDGVPIHVVGVAADSSVGAIGQAAPPVFYLAVMQQAQPHVTLIVRTSGDPAALAPVIRREIAGLNAAVAPVSIGTLEGAISRQGLFQFRAIATLTGLFGLIGIVLAVVGLYGVVSFIVERQTQEIGVRMALGATRGNVLRMVLGNGISLVTAGLIAGLATSMVSTRFMSSLLIGISPWDLKTFAAIAFLLLGAAIVASWIPAMRAMRVEPSAALRYE
jgi:putative ABC transport system permease protein